MIEQLKNSDLVIARKMHDIFQASYSIEAKLLNAIDFPPLKRPINDYQKSDTQFYGYIKDKVLVGVIEIKHTKDFTHIQSLVVDPNFFRQGIGRLLMAHTLKTYDTDLFVVETGVDNDPAIHLYRQLGFVEVKQWDTDHGVRKIRFELENMNGGIVIA